MSKYSAKRHSTADLQRLGDLGSMRRRDYGRARSAKYDPALIEAIALRSMEMKDLFEAGRWFFIIDSQHPRAHELVQYYIEACGGLGHAAGQAPLRSRVFDARNELAPAVRERFLASSEKFRSHIMREREHTPWKFAFRERIGMFVASVSMLFMLVSLIVGLFVVVRTLVRWIFA